MNRAGTTFATASELAIKPWVQVLGFSWRTSLVALVASARIWESSARARRSLLIHSV